MARRLTDLYILGREQEFDDGQGSVKVWIQKLNDLEQQESLRNANSARARLRAQYVDQNGQNYNELVAESLELDRDQIIDILIARNQAEVRIAKDAELASEDPWGKDKYLEGLRDTWENGLQKKWLENNEDPEAKNVYDELNKFADEVDRRTEVDVAKVRAELEELSDPELRGKFVERLLDTRANNIFIEEFFRSRLYFAVRDPEDHKKRYFESRDEVDELSTRIYTALRDAYDDLEVDVMTGKDSPPQPPSSPPSEPPKPSETSESSSLVGATA